MALVEPVAPLRAVGVVPPTAATVALRVHRTARATMIAVVAGTAGGTLYRRIVDALNSGNAALLGEALAPDVVDHDAPPDQAPGREGFEDWVARVREAFPDLTVEIEDL